MTLHEQEWWKNGVVYQIYPASFKDSNADGIGDLPGVLDRLDYLKGLGVDIIWISPVFASPQVDMGYDISDYEKIHKPYGTVEDVENLIAACHQRGMRLLLDLVVNHTSDQHPWFQESRSSLDNPKRGWYHWRPPKFQNGVRQPPNNWKSRFSGSAWAWDEATGEYYLHIFADGQPDLNWDNPELRKAVYDSAINFWLEKGVDGFRIDTITIYGKDPNFPDAPVTDPNSEWQMGSRYYRNLPRNFEYISEMNQMTFGRFDAMTVGEYGPLHDTSLALDYCSRAKKRIDMGFQFETVELGYGSPDRFDLVPFSLQDFRATHAKWQKFIEGTDGWTSIFLENHDIGRSVSRFGCDNIAHQHTESSAKLLALLQATATGTLFIYQGQEIGMTNIPDDWPIEEYKDIETQNYWRELQSRGSSKEVLSRAMSSIKLVGRDHARTPMQWNGEPNAGFSEHSTPWMRIHDNSKVVNVANQAQDDHSVLSFWKHVLHLRRQNPSVWVHGAYNDQTIQNSAVMQYTKSSSAGSEILVVLNFSCESQTYERPERWAKSKLLLVNYDDGQEISGSQLRPWEARLYGYDN